jgi:ABC-2 type transport system permease protein
MTARPFYWSVRRELWENRAIWIAPLVVAAIVLAAFVFSSGHLLDTVRRAGTSARAADALNMPYAAAAAGMFLISAIVAVFYCLGALQGERRDRSLLFWKSLPVSDTTTVLAKAAVPVVVQPLLVLAVTLATHLAILGWSCLVLLANGVSPGAMTAHLNLPLMWVMVPYGLAVNALWDIPVIGWLLLVSAWSRRMPFVWAVAPWLGLALFEFLAFRTRRVLAFLDDRLFGGFAHAFSVDGKGQAPISSLSQVDPGRVLADPGLWGGLVVGALFLAACVWLRRTREPV